MKPTAKSLILDLLSTLRRGAMPVRALVAAGRLFGLAENNVRVSLARLCTAEMVERDERGSYRLGEQAIAVDSHVASWHKAAERMSGWDGAFVAVHRPGATAARKADRRALGLLGFVELEPGLALRPDNLVGGVSALRAELSSLGLDPRAAVFELRALDAERDLAVREAWRGGQLERGYATLRARLEASEARLPTLSRERAMIESFEVGGDAIRCIARDPLLPAPIVARGALAALVAAARRYDLAGRACWADFLAAHGVELRRARSAPVDLRTIQLAGALPKVQMPPSEPLGAAQ